MLRNVFYIFICRFLSGLPLSPARVEGLGSDSFHLLSPPNQTSKIQPHQKLSLRYFGALDTVTELSFSLSNPFMTK